MFSTSLTDEAARLLQALRAKGLKLATAESCTGGLIAALLTGVPGSSDVIECGFVSYSNAAKASMLGVAQSLLDQHGAVSEAVARAMAVGALAHSQAHVAVAVTGVAGPGGSSADKPVGLVHLGVARQGAATLHRELRLGDIGRAPVRLASVEAALQLVWRALESPPGA